MSNIPKNALPVENLYLEGYLVEFDRSIENKNGNVKVTVRIIFNGKEFTHVKNMWRSEVASYLNDFGGEL